ncbi:MAG: VOC family protein [Rhodanobacteraceae bacterium]
MKAGALRLLRVGRNVADLERARRFYCEALGFVYVDARDDAPPAWTRLPGVSGSPPRAARLRLGAQEIELTAFDPPGAAYPSGSTSADLWFQHCAIVTDDMDAAYARLRRHGGFKVISRNGPQTLPVSSGGVTAFKFRDPDGHPLELIAFPPVTGDPVWQTRGNDPTLGIDHSAISVADADRSVAFYTALGLSQASRQTNRGPEQQRLDDLPDVIVDVVALQPADAHTPHIELLAYRVPSGRASMQTDARDIAADRLVLQMQGLTTLLKTLTDAHAGIVSTAGISGGDGAQTALLRDPDGHWFVLTE